MVESATYPSPLCACVTFNLQPSTFKRSMNLQELAADRGWKIRKLETGFFQLKNPNGTIYGRNKNLTKEDCRWWITRTSDVDDRYEYNRMYAKANGAALKRRGRRKTPEARFKKLGWKLVGAGTDWTQDDEPKRYRLKCSGYITGLLDDDDLKYYLRNPAELEKLRPTTTAPTTTAAQQWFDACCIPEGRTDKSIARAHAENWCQANGIRFAWNEFCKKLQNIHGVNTRKARETKGRRIRIITGLQIKDQPPA